MLLLLLVVVVVLLVVVLSRCKLQATWLIRNPFQGTWRFSAAAGVPLEGPPLPP